MSAKPSNKQINEWIELSKIYKYKDGRIKYKEIWRKQKIKGKKFSPQTIKKYIDAHYYGEQGGENTETGSDTGLPVVSSQFDIEKNFLAEDMEMDNDNVKQQKVVKDVVDLDIMQKDRLYNLLTDMGKRTKRETIVNMFRSGDIDSPKWLEYVLRQADYDNKTIRFIVSAYFGEDMLKKKEKEDDEDFEYEKKKKGKYDNVLSMLEPDLEEMALQITIQSKQIELEKKKAELEAIRNPVQSNKVVQERKRRMIKEGVFVDLTDDEWAEYNMRQQLTIEKREDDKVPFTDAKGNIVMVKPEHLPYLQMQMGGRDNGEASRLKELEDKLLLMQQNEVKGELYRLREELQGAQSMMANPNYHLEQQAQTMERMKQLGLMRDGGKDKEIVQLEQMGNMIMKQMDNFNTAIDKLDGKADRLMDLWVYKEKLKAERENQLELIKIEQRFSNPQPLSDEEIEDMMRGEMPQKVKKKDRVRFVTTPPQRGNAEDNAVRRMQERQQNGGGVPAQNTPSTIRFNTGNEIGKAQGGVVSPTPQTKNNSRSGVYTDDKGVQKYHCSECNANHLVSSKVGQAHLDFMN